MTMADPSPGDFFETVVLPNAEDFDKEFTSLRHAFNAVMAIDALVARLYHWLVVSRPGVTAAKGDMAYRKELGDAAPLFKLLLDLASGHRHYRLDRSSRSITTADQSTVKYLDWNEGDWNEARWDSDGQVYVQDDSGRHRAVDYLVREGIKVVRAEMEKHGVGRRTAP